MTEEGNNIALTAPTVDEAIFARRRAAIAETLDLLEAGEPEAARTRITGSVLGEQARPAGIRVMPA